jgi:hypothetical protein
MDGKRKMHSKIRSKCKILNQQISKEIERGDTDKK